MKNTDLRIGNWVSLYGKFEKVESIGTYGVSFDTGFAKYTLPNLKPIPLKEEMLLKCGFEFNKKYYHSKYIKDLIKLIYDLDQKILYFKYKGEFIPMIQIPKNIEYLHELQNVIHALTGQELKIEL